MSLDELLRDVRDLELLLRSAEVQNFFKNQPEEIRNHFVSFRHEVTFLVGKLTNAQLKRIENKLDELSADLNQGINDLRSQIKALDDEVAIMDTLSRALGLAARIAVLC